MFPYINQTANIFYGFHWPQKQSNKQKPKKSFRGYLFIYDEIKQNVFAVSDQQC